MQEIQADLDSRSSRYCRIKSTSEASFGMSADEGVPPASCWRRRCNISAFIRSSSDTRTHFTCHNQQTGVTFYTCGHYYRYYCKYTVSQKKGTSTLSIVLLKRLTDFNDFWHKYSWHNWPSNDNSSSHLTQHLLLHYLGKTQLMRYYILYKAVLSLH